MNEGLNDYYFNEPDFSELENFIVRNGTQKTFEKGDFLTRQGELKPQIGYIEEGGFRFVRTDKAGNEHIVGYSFAPTLVGEYSSCLCHRPALADIQAIRPSRVHLLPYAKIQEFWNTSPDHQRLGRLVAEQLFAMTYRRLLDYCSSTPEERYIDLMRRYPELKELRPLREIASYIGVTPETVSAIRRKLSGRSPKS